MSNPDLDRVNRELWEVLRTSSLPPADQVIALSTLCIMVMDHHLKAAHEAAGEEFLRMMRRTLHVLPESITQFIQAWQPGRTSQATKTAGELIGRKFVAVIEESKQIDTKRRIFHRRV